VSSYLSLSAGLPGNGATFKAQAHQVQPEGRFTRRALACWKE
jgi:hypothetical protein